MIRKLDRGMCACVEMCGVEDKGGDEGGEEGDEGWMAVLK